MNNPITLVESQSTPQITPPESTDQPHHPSTNPNTFSSLNDLKEKAPQVYQKMLECMAMEVCRESEKHTDKMKKIRRNTERK